MKPATRFLAIALSWVVVVAALAAAGAVWQTRHTAKSNQLQRLQSVPQLVHELGKARINELQLRTHYLASDPAFVDYVTQALVPDPHLGGAIDGASISNLLDERRQGYDGAVVLDFQGKVAARSGRVLLRTAAYSRDALIAQSLKSRTPSAGLWSGNGQLAWVVAEPLMRGGVLQGLLVTSKRVTNDFSDSVADISGTEVAILVPAANGATIAASSKIGTLVRDQLGKRHDNPLAVTERDGRELTIHYAGGSSLSWASQLDTSVGKAALLVLPPGHGNRKDSGSPTMPWIAAIIVLALLAVLLVTQIWRRTYVPMQQMHDIIERAANGERLITLRTRGSASVTSLSDAINRLLRYYQK